MAKALVGSKIGWQRDLSTHRILLSTSTYINSHHNSNSSHLEAALLPGSLNSAAWQNPVKHRPSAAAAAGFENHDLARAPGQPPPLLAGQEQKPAWYKLVGMIAPPWAVTVEIPGVQIPSGS